MEWFADSNTEWKRGFADSRGVDQIQHTCSGAHDLHNSQMFQKHPQINI